MSESSDRSVVITVDGPIPADSLGLTLVHEHLHLDTRPLLQAVHGYKSTSSAPMTLENAAEARWNPGTHPDNYDLTDIDVIAPEVALYIAAGGRSIVDVTPAEFGRAPLKLRTIAARTGAVVIMGGGHYLAPTQPSDVRDASAEVLAGTFVGEFQRGVGDTGVRPGVLGELGTGTVLDPDEAKVLRAAAWSQQETGLCISVHLHPWSRVGHDVLDVLFGEGALPERVVLGHLTPYALDYPYLRSLLDRGVFGAFDLFGFDHSLLSLGRYPPSDYDVVGTIGQLIRDGYGDRLLISHDIGVRTRLHRYGGWGYDHILRHVVPLLMAQDIDAAEVDRLLTANPREALAIDPLRLDTWEK